MRRTASNRRLLEQAMSRSPRATSSTPLPESPSFYEQSYFSQYLCTILSKRFLHKSTTVHKKPREIQMHKQGRCVLLWFLWRTSLISNRLTRLQDPSRNHQQARRLEAAYQLWVLAQPWSWMCMPTAQRGSKQLQGSWIIKYAFFHQLSSVFLAMESYD